MGTGCYRNLQVPYDTEDKEGTEESATDLHMVEMKREYSRSTADSHVPLTYDDLERGVIKTAGGEIYDGEHRGDSREGHGTTWYANGSVCQGWWRDHRMEGPGTYWFPHGSVLISGFRRGAPKGTGVVWSADR